MRTKFFLACLVAVVAAIGTPAYAGLLCGGTEVGFSVTAVSPSDPSKPQDASGCASIDPGADTITIRIENDAPLITNIPSVLDGFSFTLLGPTPSSINLSSVAAAGFLDCTAGNTCKSVGTFHNYAGGGSDLSSPYNWAVVTGPSGAPINFTFGLDNPALLAGGGSLRPAGILDGNFATGGSNHLNSLGHNDYLLGPVTFTLTYTGNDPNGFGGEVFYFGTLGEAHAAGDPQPTPDGVPEPGTMSLALLSLGFTGFAALRRRKQQ